MSALAEIRATARAALWTGLLIQVTVLPSALWDRL